MNINYFFDCRQNYFLHIVIITEEIDLSQELITTRTHRTIFVFFLIVLKYNVLIVMFFILFSLLANHYVLTYGKRTALTIDDKVIRFSSELGFIHSS